MTARPTWFHRWRNPGEGPTLSFGRLPNGYLLRFHGRADFTVDFAARAIVGWRRGSATVTTVRHLLIDQVVPLVLSRDRLVLHASAVATPCGAVAFVGSTGSGKSTLAAALALAGFPLLCDDCLVVEPARCGFLVRPFYPGVRLWADSVRAVGMSRRSSAPVAHFTRKRRIDARHLSYQVDGVRSPASSCSIARRRGGSPAADAHARCAAATRSCRFSRARFSSTSATPPPSAERSSCRAGSCARCPCPA